MFLLQDSYPQYIERHHSFCAMDHLLGDTDDELEREVENQMSGVEVKQAVGQVTPPLGQNAIPVG